MVGHDVKRILFYDDAAEFGGHEVMTLTAVKYLLEEGGAKVGFMYYAGNERLRQELSSLQKEHEALSLYPVKFRSSRLQNLTTLFAFKSITQLGRLMRQFSPDIVVIAQGRIELSTMGLLAAKRSGLRTVSYIPMAHPLTHISELPGAGLRDLLNRYFYQLPDRFITVSQSMARMLRQQGAQSRISVVYNGIDWSRYRRMDREQSRARYELEEWDNAIAVVGRIQFRQKGHDFLIKAISRFRDQFERCKLLVVGDGPDAPKLKEMVLSLDLSHIVRFLPWSNSLSELYSAIDMLVIPSNFEGVPVVMLEGMYFGLPVVASNIDGMAEILPRSWLFKPTDENSFVETLRKVKNRNNDFEIKTNQDLVSTRFTYHTFVAEFAHILSDELCACSPAEVAPRNNDNKKIPG